jgi:hypothetical protein
MGKKIRVWLDSGANIHSCRSQVIDLEDIGISDEEWAAMPEEKRAEEMRQIAFEQSDWGFTEVEGEDDGR